jgi:hypothetical protein
MANEIFEVHRTAATLPDYQQGNNVRGRTNQRGEALTLSTFDDYVKLGAVFSANVGTASTPAAFATVTYDENQPEFGLDVPAGVTCIPLSISVYMETLPGTISETFFRMDDGLLGVGTSTAVTENNLYQQASDSQLATARCTPRSLYVGNANAITTGPEFARWGNPFITATTEGGPHNEFHWSRFADGFGPIAEGEASFSGYVVAAATAVTGFLTFTWAEFTT